MQLQHNTPPSTQPSDNLCICGDTPPWLNSYPYVNGTNGTATNATATNGTATNGTAAMGPLLLRNGTSLGTPCSAWPPQGEPQKPPEWYVDNPALLALKEFILANVNTPQAQYALDFWNQYRVPCTNELGVGTCELCDWQDTCGVVRQSDMKRLCNYRFVSCRDRRVVGLHLGKKVGAWRGCH